jgi:glutamate receptor, ionotropic, invertebrate
MIIAPLKMTAEREEIIDFVAPYFEQTGILIVSVDTPYFP